MLVTAIEAKPLRSLERVRVELEPGDRQRHRPQRNRQDEPGRGALLRPHRPLVPHLRPPRPDPVRRLAGAGRGDDPRRGRARAPAARLGQPQRRPAPPARRQPGRPGDDRPQPPAGGGLRPRPADPGQGPAGRAPRPPRRLPRRPLAGAGGAAQALRAGGGAAQRAALAAGGAATAPRRTCGSGTRGWPRPPRRWSRRGPRRSPSWPSPSPKRSAELGLEAGALEYAPRAAGTAEEIRAGLEERREQDIRLGRSSWGPHLDELKLTQRRAVAAALRLAGSAARRPARPPLRRARGAAGGAPGDAAAAARRRDERARPGPARAAGRRGSATAGRC